MTLHWWNHWFWITFWATAVCLCNSTPTEVPLEDATEAVRVHPRTGKAIGYSPKLPLSTPSYQKVSIVFPLPTSSDQEDDGPSLRGELHQIEFQKMIDGRPEVDVVTVATEKNTTAAINHTVTPAHVANKIEETNVKNVTEPPKAVESNHTANATVAVAEKIEPVESSTKASQNSSEIINTTAITTTESDMAVIPIAEHPIKNDSINIVNVVEEPSVSTVRALSLETGRRTPDFGRRAADLPSNTVTSGSDIDQGLDAGAVAGICFGTLVVMALAGAISFVLYRRRYLNKPQTLNDKCSNPDSSGYIDDSTIRENSEEMYSLDNDSFLNSLEAMTIQNYWTDSVKHTKL